MIDRGTARARGSVAVLALLLPVTSYAAWHRPPSASAPSLHAASVVTVTPIATVEPVRLPSASGVKRATPLQRGRWTVRTSRLDVPGTALIAYRFAARTLKGADPECGLRWSLLAAIGRIESDHGRYAGAELGADGLSDPAIRGVPLNGKGPVAAVHDTDLGLLDGDKTWDRAVGPMQFLPVTWSVVGVDADGDGQRNPDDLHDAALAAAVYLCAYPGSIASGQGEYDAIFRYNHSARYVAAVRRIERAYRHGEYRVTERLAYLSVTFSARAVPDDLGHQAAGAPDDSADDSGDVLAASGPLKLQELHEGPKPQPGSPAPEPSLHPSLSPAPSPSPTPTPTPDPTPTPTPDPTPTPEPTVELNGTLLRCDQDWCLDDRLLDLGTQVMLDAPAEHDYDGDGLLETVTEELDGLTGRVVTLTVDADTTPAVVRRIEGLAYR